MRVHAIQPTNSVGSRSQEGSWKIRVAVSISGRLPRVYDGIVDDVLAHNDYFIA